MELTSTYEGEIGLDGLRDAPSSDMLRLRAIRIMQDEEVTAQIDIGREFTVHIEYDVLQATKVITNFVLVDHLGTQVLRTGNFTAANIGEDPLFGKVLAPGHYSAYCTIPGELLNDGTFRVQAFLAVAHGRLHAWFIEGLSFSAYDTGKMRGDFTRKWVGLVRPRLKWRSILEPSGD